MLTNLCRCPVGPYYKSKLELKSNSGEISLINIKDLKFEFCQFKLK